ncbi:hypothetical protein H103_01807 [Trichophyton rubrum CBS 288.86]|uniref:Uncharacterized protein n=1 Tax=Trichophyton rubrum CBS 288.86 TaxID=1215330 RepID=A0A022WBH8_TRIRU|nr:hypothetical protein H102_01797 [Trichophyton rubrum CBS 100081]EZF55649.1 hypothetical protein H103_01807 [Trichophyton rubrum CBS 288.86]EZF87631.1 hypothetical protein H110_01808 [Trichophyton rubrum MR1448]
MSTSTRIKTLVRRMDKKVTKKLAQSRQKHHESAFVHSFQHISNNIKAIKTRSSISDGGYQSGNRRRRDQKPCKLRQASFTTPVRGERALQPHLCVMGDAREIIKPICGVKRVFL